MKRLGLILMVVAGVVFISGCSGKPVTGLGEEGLLPCPDSPNCVSSTALDEEHGIAPLVYTGSRNDAFKRLKKAVLDVERSNIISETPDYLHAEFKSKLFKFVDDVEFWFPKDQGIIHVRSASRLGYSDLGVNRKRVETIRQLFGKNGE